MKTIIKIPIFLTFENGAETVESILQTALKPEIDTIVLVIASDGGDTVMVSSIVEALKISGKKLISVGMGSVASAATAIFMSADRRILFPDTEFLIHNCDLSSVDKGTPDFLKQKSAEVRKESDKIYRLINEKATIPMKTLKRKVANDADWILTEKELKKYNIITEEYNVESVREILTEDIFVK